MRSVKNISKDHCLIITETVFKQNVFKLENGRKDSFERPEKLNLL